MRYEKKAHSPAGFFAVNCTGIYNEICNKICNEIYNEILQWMHSCVRLKGQQKRKGRRIWIYH